MDCSSGSQKVVEPESEPSAWIASRESFHYKVQTEGKPIICERDMQCKKRVFWGGEVWGGEVSCGSFGTFSFTSNPETPEVHRGVKLQHEVWGGGSLRKETYELRFAKPTVVQ